MVEGCALSGSDLKIKFRTILLTSIRGPLKMSGVVIDAFFINYHFISFIPSLLHLPGTILRNYSYLS